MPPRSIAGGTGGDRRWNSASEEPHRTHLHLVALKEGVARLVDEVKRDHGDEPREVENHDGGASEHRKGVPAPPLDHAPHHVAWCPPRLREEKRLREQLRGHGEVGPLRHQELWRKWVRCRGDVGRRMRGRSEYGYSRETRQPMHRAQGTEGGQEPREQPRNPRAPLPLSATTGEAVPKPGPHPARHHVARRGSRGAWQQACASLDGFLRAICGNRTDMVVGFGREAELTAERAALTAHAHLSREIDDSPQNSMIARNSPTRP